MAEPSFGGGIALTDTIPGSSFAKDQYQLNQRRKRDEAKAGASAKIADDKDTQKYLNSIMVQVGQGKTHQRYADKQREVVAKILREAEKAKAESAITGQNWKSSTAFQQAYMQALTEHRDILAASDNQYKMEQAAIQGLQDGSADPDAAMAFLSASRVGDNSRLTGDPYEYHTEGVNDITGLPMSSINPYQKINLPELIHKDLTDPKNMTHIQTIKSDQGLPGFVRGALSESGLPNTEEEARVLQKVRGYSEKPTSVESIINDKVENYYREMERMVRSEAIDLAKAEGKDFAKLKKEERMPFVKEAALNRAIPMKGQKITEKMFRTPVAPKPTQAEKDKEWSTEGSTFSNAKNVITVSQISDTDIPKLVNMPALSNNPNLKVYSFSHKDVMENKPLVMTDSQGRPQNGIFKGVVLDDKNPDTAMIIMAVNSEESPTGMQYMSMPYTPANKDAIKNEYGKTAEEALAAIGGKTGTTTDGGEVTSTKKSSGPSKSIKTVTSQADYDALPSGSEYYGGDGKLRRKK